MERLPVSLPTTILLPLTRTLRTSVIQRTRRTPLRATSDESGFADIAAGRGEATLFHPRALVLGGEDPSHDLAGLDLLLHAPELPVAQEARGRVGGRDRVHVRADPREALAPPGHVLEAEVHP